MQNLKPTKLKAQTSNGSWMCFKLPNQYFGPWAEFYGWSIRIQKKKISPSTKNLCQSQISHFEIAIFF